MESKSQIEGYQEYLDDWYEHRDDKSWLIAGIISFEDMYGYTTNHKFNRLEEIKQILDTFQNHTILEEPSTQTNEMFENGGKGSGHFGHSGRPGEVGGSAPSGHTIAVSESTVTAKWLDEHRGFLKSRGYTDEWIDKQVELTKKQELRKKAIAAKTVDKFDKIIEQMKAEGLYTDEWWEAIGKPTRTSIEAREQRKTEAVNPEQQEAIDDLLSDTGIRINPKDEKWLRENVPKQMVEELHNELNLAFKEGLSNNLRLSFTDAKQRQGSCTVEGPSYETVLVRLTKDMMTNVDLTRSKTNLKGENGKRWWTAKKDQIGHTIRHELGHALAWQATKNQGLTPYQYNYENDKIVYNAKIAYTGFADRLADATPEQRARFDALIYNEGFKMISQYGRKNSAETIAESYVNPDYSDFTKEVYNQLQKALKNELKATIYD